MARLRTTAINRKNKLRAFDFVEKDTELSQFANHLAGLV